LNLESGWQMEFFLLLPGRQRIGWPNSFGKRIGGVAVDLQQPNHKDYGKEPFQERAQKSRFHNVRSVLTAMVKTQKEKLLEQGFARLAKPGKERNTCAFTGWWRELATRANPGCWQARG